MPIPQLQKTSKILRIGPIANNLQPLKVSQKVMKSDLRCSDSTWLSQKIHVSKVLKLKNQNVNTSASKNIQNFENRPNSQKVTALQTPQKSVHISADRGGDGDKPLN